MRGQSNRLLSFGEGFIDPQLLQLDEELKHVNELLAEREFLKPFEAVFETYIRACRQRRLSSGSKSPAHLCLADCPGREDSPTDRRKALRGGVNRQSHCLVP